MAEPLKIQINGIEFSVSPGTSVAAAIVNSGTTQFRRSVSGEERGPVCGMGICYECRATIDGMQHQRTCMISCVSGMVIKTDA